MSTVQTAVSEIADRGFAVIRDLISPERLEKARVDSEALLEPTPHPMPGVDGGVYGRMAKAYFPKTRAFDDLLCLPTVLAIAKQVLNPDDRAFIGASASGIQLSGTMIKDVQPREAHRHFHRDDDLYPITRPHPPVVMNSLLAIDDFTFETGATWFVEGSHKWNEPVRQDAEYVVAEMPAGSMVLFDGSVWHNNGSNLTYDKCRRALNVYYSSNWLRQLGGPHLGLPTERLSELPDTLRDIV